MNWNRWLPWRRSRDEEAQRDIAQADQRLEESAELRRRAEELNRHMHGHLRRNRFAAMIEQAMGGHR